MKVSVHGTGIGVALVFPGALLLRLVHSDILFADTAMLDVGNVHGVLL
jgi:hypothetical protein